VGHQRLGPDRRTYTDASAHVHGFLYNPNGGTYTTLDDPLATGGTFAYGINAMGQIVGRYHDANGAHGFLYSNGTYTTLDDPLAVNGTLAYGINDSGQIVGYYTDASSDHGFVLTTAPNPAPPAGTTAVMILRGANSSSYAAGQYEIYDIGNNAILAGYQLGNVGTDWAYIGLGGFNGTDTSDMVLRNATTGAFEVYNIANNQITGAALLGQVGMDWQFGGFAAVSSTASMGDSSDAAQLVQAMARFGGGSDADESTAALGDDTSQQPFLTTPQQG
jgi:probable HAF family extracellular repeat protein